MTTKKAIIYIIIAVVFGVALGGISKLFDVDLAIYSILAPIVVFGALYGGTEMVSKKKKDDSEDSEDK
jgi:hypothetical protein